MSSEVWLEVRDAWVWVGGCGTEAVGLRMCDASGGFQVFRGGSEAWGFRCCVPLSLSCDCGITAGGVERQERGAQRCSPPRRHPGTGDDAGLHRRWKPLPSPIETYERKGGCVSSQHNVSMPAHTHITHVRGGICGGGRPAEATDAPQRRALSAFFLCECTQMHGRYLCCRCWSLFTVPCRVLFCTTTCARPIA